MNTKAIAIVTLTILLFGIVMAKDKSIEKKLSKEKDMMRKSIVFDKNTPDVFYCPTSKPTGFDKLIVR